MRILLADDHGLVRDALGAGLNNSELQANVVNAASLDEAMLKLGHEPYDLIILDYMMPGMNGLDGLSRMIEAGGGAPVALISGAGSQEVSRKAETLGAVGFLPKTLGVEALAGVVAGLIRGERYFPAPAEPNAEAAALTRREREVLSYLYQGLQNKEIARELGLREVTVKLHVRSLCKKLDVANRTQAAMRGQELGIPPVT